MKKINFAFFGGEPLAVPTLETLYKNGLTPSLIICNPDKPAGRNLEMTPPPTKLWAIEHNIQFIQPERPSKDGINESFDVFVVVAYGKIIPKEVLDQATYGTINIHPSLLPKYRGPSPMISAILNGDTETGVTIIKIDEEMDHGPILAQEKVDLVGNEYIGDLEKTLAELGGKLLVKVMQKLPDITETEQDHSKATFVKKFKKEDSEIKLDGDPIQNWRKFRAFHNNLRTFFFKDGKRYIITDAALENGTFVIKKVIPEGRKEIDYKN